MKSHHLGLSLAAVTSLMFVLSLVLEGVPHAIALGLCLVAGVATAVTLGSRARPQKKTDA